MIRTLFAALLVALLVGCNAIKSSPSYTNVDSDRVIKQAESAIAKVAKVGYEWRDTGKILASAKAANKKKDYSTAVALAGKAERQAIAAYKQYKLEMSVFK
jgi:hypothetical protein